MEARAALSDAEPARGTAAAPSDASGRFVYQRRLGEGSFGVVCIRGELTAGPDGAAQIAAADASLRAEGIANPAALVSMYSPIGAARSAR